MANICVVCNRDAGNLIHCNSCFRYFHITCINLPQPLDSWNCQKCILDNSIKYKLTARTNVHLYQRVSSKSQDNLQKGRCGLDTQNSALLKFASEHCLIVINTVRVIGGAYKNCINSELMGILDVIKRDECILVYSVSRFCRKFDEGKRFLELLNEIGAYVYSTSENIYSDDDQFIVKLKEAENESKRLSSQTKASHNRIRSMGGHIGRVPYGFKVERNNDGIGKLIENESEQRLIKIIQMRYPRLEFLNALNKVKSYRGKPFTMNILRRIYFSK